MKILLTGEPGIGKSTILQKIIKQIHLPVSGIITKEMRNSENKRTGFESCKISGDCRLLAHITDINSKYVIANKYYVDLNIIENFVCKEIKNNKKDAVLIIDEIGRMQALSRKFLELLTTIFQTNRTVLATIVADPEPWSLTFKENPSVLLVTVTRENRAWIDKGVAELINNNNNFELLNSRQHTSAFKLLKKYFTNNQEMQIHKLITHAVPYAIKNKVIDLGKNNYEVSGNTKKHKVYFEDESHASCDCELWNGLGRYSGKKGICSHIQAVKIFRVK